ncbi:olfactory protein-like [Python bivittatus]|uniref:Olfactory protein-like n=1 Tax=Python bivittatus TaxID=176946 RepID=A0A9F5ILR8_PYTBI|nr:olfactory protein-like [Python bivittatus]
MKLLWLCGLGIALLCVPCATFEEADRCGFDQLLGKWYLLAVATNCEWMIEHMTKEITASNISRLEDGNFHVYTNFSTTYGCVEMEFIYTKLENGKYTYTTGFGDKIIDMLKTDCDNYVITVSTDLEPIEDQVCKFVSLYDRTMSVSQSVEQLFEDQVAELELDPDQIIHLANKLACTENNN